MATKFEITADTTQAVTAIKELNANMNTHLLQMTKSIEGVGQSFSKNFGGMLGIAGMVAGGFLAIKGVFAGIKNSVDAFVELNYSSEVLGETLEISGAKASVLKMALDDLHVDQEVYNNGVSKLTANLNKNEGAFTKLGVATRDSSGNLLNPTVIMQNAIDKLNHLKAGSDRNVVAAQLFGKSWQEVTPLLKLTTEKMEKARKKAENLGLISSEEAQGQAKKYKDSLNDAQDVGKAFQIAVGQGFVGMFKNLFDGFANTSEGITSFKQGLAGIISFLYILIGVLQAAWFLLNVTVEIITGLLASIIKLGEGFVHLQFGHWSDAMSSFKDATVGVFKETTNQIAEDSEKLKNRISADAKGVQEAFQNAEPKKRVSNREFNKTASGEKGQVANDKVNDSEKWAEELAAQKLAFLSNIMGSLWLFPMSRPFGNIN